MSLRTAAFAVFMVLFVLPVCAGTLTHVYDTSLSSSDFSVMPRLGEAFSDSQGNLLVVSYAQDGVVLFDSVINRKPYKAGEALHPQARVLSAGVVGFKDYSIAHISMTASTYPVSPMVAAGVSWAGDLSVYGLVGVEVVVPLSNLWNTRFTLIRNGKVRGWLAGGLSVCGKEACFAAFSGASYRHNAGNFHWEVGFSSLALAGKDASLSPSLGIGVDF